MVELSRSSLLSECTNGLVGGFKTKLDEKDEERDGSHEALVSTSD
jgi:hypothetical protein